MNSLSEVINVIVGIVASLGGLSLIKFLFFMKPERRMKNIEADEKQLGVLQGLIESLNKRIEQQDAKIRELNERVDKLYEEKHVLEAEKNRLIQRNALLELQLKEAEHNVCVRPDDECMKRQPPRDHCRLKRLARGYYDKFYTKEQLEQGEKECDEEDKELFNDYSGDRYEDSGIPEKPDKG